MSWFKKDSPQPQAIIDISINVKPPEFRRGLPVYEAEIQGGKLQRRDITITPGEESRKIRIEDLRAEYRAGLLPGDAPVLVTTQYGDRVCYCGEGYSR